MKILLTVDSLRPPLTGVGRYTWELASRLPSHPAIQSVQYLAHGRLTTLGSMPEKILGDHHPKKIKRKAWKRYLMRQPMVSFAYEQVTTLLTKIKANSLDVDLFHGTNFFVPKMNIPSVVHVHDLSVFVNPKWHPQTRIKRVGKMLPQSVNNSTLITTGSNATREEVISYFGLAEDRVAAVPLGVDPIFKPRTVNELQPILAEYGLVPNEYCLFVSTIEPRKNLLRLINAYRALPKPLLNRWPLVLVGEAGWNSDDIHQAIKKAQMEGWLKYFGFVPQKVLPLFYAGCRLFAYPSLYEGFGLPIVEAMASGVPVLTSNCSSMPEVSGGAAYLADPQDEKSIYNGLLLGLEDESWRLQAIKAGLTQASRMTWEACVDQVTQLYKRILAQAS